VLASSFFDPMLGIDIHWEMVPMPAPTPLPLPNPYTGIVFDPIGLAANLVISNLIGAVMGAPFRGPVLFWGIPATNTGTESVHLPGHILMPPGTSWAPVPRTPMPALRPGETPKPPKPVTPDNDAMIIFGSKTVTVMGSNAVRLSDLALSCSEPTRLPSSVVLSVPKGAPILIGGPMSLDLVAALFAVIRTRFAGDSLQALVSRMAPGRLRNSLGRAACFFTGHPVDVASGKVLTDAVDAELPGPMPLVIRRTYISSCCERDRMLGHGWSHSLDQALWNEPGKIVYLADDGREIEFDTFDLPGHRMQVGDEVWQPIDRLRLRRESEREWSITAPDQKVLRFAPLFEREGAPAVLRRISAPGGLVHVDLQYGAAGVLERVRDSAGRELRFEHDARGRLSALLLPNPSGAGYHARRTYRYDEHGDLVEVQDAAGASWKYEYVAHLLVREQVRSGMSFYFEYDGLGADAWCVRTWGDGGIYDHQLDYDRKQRMTVVKDSLGRVTRYYMNLAGAVTRIVDALGGETLYEYDAALQRTAIIDALGQRVSLAYDASGNCVSLEKPEGASVALEFDEGNRPLRATDLAGGEWQRRYDARGLLREVTDPIGRRKQLRYDELGLLSELERADGGRIALARTSHGLVDSIADTAGQRIQFGYDALGRMIWAQRALGGHEAYHWDLEGNLRTAIGSDGRTVHFEWTADGDLLEARDARGPLLRIEYAGFRKPSRIWRPDGAQQITRNTEQQITSVENAAGEVQKYEYDDCGRVKAVTRFDGKRWQYKRDPLGRLTEIVRPSGERVQRVYDAGGRLSEIRYPGGAVDRFTYRADGALLEAANETASVRFERDVLGRITREWQDEDWIDSRYDAVGRRIAFSSSLGMSTALELAPDGGVRGMRTSMTGRSWAMELERDAQGAELRRLLPHGLVAQWKRDPRGQPLERDVRQDGQVLAASRFQWLDGDHLAALSDEQDRTTRYLRNESAALLGAEYPEGDRQWRIADRAGNVFGSADLSDREYGAGGRLERLGAIRWRHDADGRCIGRSEGDRSWSYRYDGASRLVEVVQPDQSSVRFAYDALGRRLRKESAAQTTRWVWDRAVPAHELSSTRGCTTWAFDPGGFSPAGVLGPQGAFSIVTDHLGAPSSAHYATGGLAWRAPLDLFGVPRPLLSSQFHMPWRWPGQYADEETGLVYNRYRYYDPSTGCYLTPDPLGLGAGGTPYGYVPDPTGSIDPLGLESCVTYYHGTTADSAERIASRGIDLSRGTPGLDFNPFGRGAFYVTTKLEQAARWADGIARDVGGEPAIVRFDVPESELAALDRRVFGSTDADWQDFTRNSRSGVGGEGHHNHDIVEGPFVTNPSVAANPMSTKPIRGRGQQTAVCTPQAAAVFDRSNPRKLRDDEWPRAGIT
jgi:RHS repeat-associated protein